MNTMNTALRSLVIGLACSASALTASATVFQQSTADQGCLVSNEMDGAPAASSGFQHSGLGLKRADAYGGLSSARIASADISLGENQGEPQASLGMTRISTRVERLSQGIAATPLVQTLTHPDKGQEPQLSMLLLAALGVVTFVARRRRNP